VKSEEMLAKIREIREDIDERAACLEDRIDYHRKRIDVYSDHVLDYMDRCNKFERKLMLAETRLERMESFLEHIPKDEVRKALQKKFEEELHE